MKCPCMYLEGTIFYVKSNSLPKEVKECDICDLCIKKITKIICQVHVRNIIVIFLFTVSHLNVPSA